MLPSVAVKCRASAAAVAGLLLVGASLESHAQMAVAGEFNGNRVRVVDVTAPGAPVLRGILNTSALGISSVGIDATGSIVIAGQQNGCTIARVLITNPDVPVETGNLCLPFIGVSSVAVVGTVAVIGQFNGPRVAVVDISAATPVLLANLLTTLTGISSITASGTCAIAGEQNGNRVVPISLAGAGSSVGAALNILAFSGISSVGMSGARGLAGQQFGPGVQKLTVGAGCALTLSGGAFNVPSLVGVRSVAVSGGRAIVGEENGPDVAILDVTGVSPVLVGATLNTGFAGVSWVALNGALGAAGQFNGPGVRSITGATGAAPALGGSVLTGMPGVSSVALTTFSPPRVSAPATLAFGNVNVGSSATLPLTIGNTGGSALNLTSIATSAPFSVASATLSVAALASGSVNVTCTPTAAGSVTRNLTANTNDPSSPTITVSLTCTGVVPPPAIVLSVSSLAFGVVQVGSSRTMGITVSNSGGLPLQVTGIATSNASFTVSPTSLAVNPGTSQMLNVTCSPTAEVVLSGNLTANTTDPTKPTITVPLTCTGGQAHIAVSPSPLDFGNVAVCQSRTLPLTVSNTGTLDLVVNPITLGAGPFTRTPASLTVSGGASGTVQVTFTPAATGAAAAAMTLASNDLATPNLAVQLTGNGTPMPPPQIAVTPTSLNFGAVLVNFFIGKRITVRNNGACAPLTVTLTSSSSTFPVTSDPNPTSAPPFMVVNATIAPMTEQTFVVVFAPTTTGAANGTLTITHNDPAAAPVTVSLSGSGVLASSTAAFSMVLDRSGSMADLLGAGGNKMDALKSAAKMFIDLLVEGQGDQLGTVEFDNLFSVLTGIANVDATQKATTKTGIDGLSPRGSTSIGGGLQTGLAQVAGAAPARKVVMVFTDGMENTAPMIATVKPTIPAATEVYAVGLGDPAMISTAALSDLAISSNARFFNPQDPLILRKDFVQVLTDAFRMNMAADPIYTIGAGQTQNIFVPLTACEHRVSFIVYWERAASTLGVEVIAPNGMVYSPSSPSTNRLVRFVDRPGYRFYQIAFPPVDIAPNAIIGPPRNGTWVIRVTGSKVTGTERYSASVIVESDLTMKLGVQRPRVGQPLTLLATLSNNGSPVTGAWVQAALTSPTRTLADILATQGARLRAMGAVPVRSRDPLTGTGALASQLFGRTRRPIVPTRTAKYQLFDDGRHGDGAANDGVYGIVLPGLKVEGAYGLAVKSEAGACSGTATREGTLSFWAASRIDTTNVGIGVTPGVTPGTVTVTLTPRTGTQSPLGPGMTSSITTTVTGGGTVSRVRDNLDGSYTIQLRGVEPGAVLQLDIAGSSLRIPLSRGTRAK